MDNELKKIYDLLGKYNNIDGIAEIKEEMNSLNTKLSEYKNMTRLNSYYVPTIICEIDKMNVSLENKYNKYYDKLSNSRFNINVFGAGNDTFEQKISTSLNILGKIAASKICNFYGIKLTDTQLNSSNTELFNTIQNVSNQSIEPFDDDIDSKMSFKVLY